MTEAPDAGAEPASTGSGLGGPARGASPNHGLAALRRWEEHGGAWRVVFSSEQRATVALLRCDGGEEVDRFTSADPSLLRFLREQRAEHPDS